MLAKEAKSVLVNNRIKKLHRLFREKVKQSVIHYDTADISQFSSNKDHLPALLKSSLIHKLTSPGYLQRYMGKRDRSLALGFRKYVTRTEKPMHKRPSNLNGFNEVVTCTNYLIATMICQSQRTNFYV